jgi:hypothetical protein
MIADKVSRMLCKSASLIDIHMGCSDKLVLERGKYFQFLYLAW